MQSAKGPELLQKNPAGYIEERINEFVRTSPGNRLSFLNDYVIWDEPLVQYADGDDPLFTEYKNIIGPVHLTPREALAAAYNKSPEEMPNRLSIICWILPIREETRKSNRTETVFASRLWSHTRYYGEKLNEQLRTYVAQIIRDAGYLATAPLMQPYFKRFKNEKGPYSNWSERHICYAAGLGTFSLSDGFITEKGIAHRCGSVVTDLVLPFSPRTATGPFANCLFFQGTNCRACIERCPAGAITEKGHDKIKCGDYLRSAGYSPEIKEFKYDNEKSTAGCGLCQTRVPCEFQNPVKKVKKEPKKKE